jgi:hypothetical protein
MERTLTAAQLICRAFLVRPGTTSQQLPLRMTTPAIAFPAQTTPSQLTIWQTVVSQGHTIVPVTSLP